MKLISDNMNNQLNILIGKCFAINRMLDRGMSLLAVRWNMYNASSILHQKVAHAYPGDKFADSISDYQSKRGAESIYPATPDGNKDYDTVIDFFNDYLAENIEFEDMIKDAIDTAIEDGDVNTKVFLNGLIGRLSPYIELSSDLVHLFSVCNDDSFKMLMLDSIIEDYIKI